MSSIGTEFKMNVHMEPVGSIHLSDADCKDGLRTDIVSVQTDAVIKP
jgi:hypothetical protein